MMTIENPYTLVLNQENKNEATINTQPKVVFIKKLAKHTALVVGCSVTAFIVAYALVILYPHFFVRTLFQIDGCGSADSYLGRQVVMVSDNLSIRYEQVYTITDIVSRESECNRALLWKSFDSAYLTEKFDTTEISEELYRSLRGDL